MDRVFKLRRLRCLTICMALAPSHATFAQQASPQPVQAKPGVSQPAADVPNDTRGGWRGACRGDIRKFCSSASGGRGKRQCLEVNLAKVSAPCLAGLNERRQQRAAALQACAADLQKFCSGIAGGGGERLRCLQQNSADVAPACGKAMATLGSGEPPVTKGALRK